jgi:hypothetical protein
VAPDEHSSVFAPGTLGTNQEYLFFLASPEEGHAAIGLAVLSGGSGPNNSGQWTLDLPRTDGYGSYAGGFGQVFNPSTKGDTCPVVADGNPAHQDQTFDMHYAAPGSIVKDPTGGPGAMLMVYEGTNACIGNVGGPILSNQDDYISLAIATSVDYGKSWPTYRGTPTFAFVPLPGFNQTQAPNAPMGALGKDVCIGNDCTTTPPASYGRYPVVTVPTSLASLMAAATPLTAKLGEQEISGFVDDISGSATPYLYANFGSAKVARAQLNGGSAPLSFQKWNGQAFASPGIGGVESSVLPAGPFENCEAPGQNQFGSSISYVDETQQYLLTFVCISGSDPALGRQSGGSQGAAWFYSTSYDLNDQSHWTTPREITGSWSEFDQSGGCPSWKGYYPTLMSLGKKPGHISTSGYVFYLWGCQGAGTPPPGRQFSNRAFTMTIGPSQPSTVFAITNLGGTSLTSSGAGSAVSLGYAEIQPNTGSSTPSGIAIFDFHQNNTLVSEVGVPATPTLLSGRIYAEIAGAVNAGLAIANPNGSPASISFYFTDANGNPAGSGSTTVGANQQIAQFLDQSPFKVYTTSTFQGTFSFTSNVPIAVVALRGFTNERGDFLMSTLPVIDTTAAPNSGTTVVPHFADGGGWITQVFLVNPTDNPMTGSLQMMNPAGAAVNVTIGGQTNNSFPYSIPKRTSQKLSTAGLGATTVSGSIRIVPTGGGAGPTPLIVFSYRAAGITLSEAGVPVTSGSAFRSYVESSGAAGQPGNIQSGIAVANASSASASVTFDMTDLTGAPVPGILPVTVPLAAFGQTAKYLSDIFPSLPNPFKGVVRITTTSSGLSVVGLRVRFNERGDLLATTTPPANENSSTPLTPVFFPQVADGGGYTTQFILFSGTAGQNASGALQLVKQDGSPLGVALNRLTAH